MKKIPLVDVKRKDRAVEDETWIRTMLRQTPIGVLATCTDGQPYLTSRHFWFDEEVGAIYMHGAPEGRTHNNVEANPSVCFTVSEMGRLLPAPSAFGMGSEFASVVIFGRAQFVTDTKEKERALQSLLEKYFTHLVYGRDYRGIQPEELARTAVLRIDIERWSGKRRQAPEDYPGAFRYKGD